jgi:hypothetical protein
MSETDDLGALVLSLADRCLEEYLAKPFPEDREPITLYFSLLDNLADMANSPYHFSQGVSLLKSCATEQATYFYKQDSARVLPRPGPLKFGLGMTIGAAVTLVLGGLTQNVATVYAGLAGICAGCAGLAAATRCTGKPGAQSALENYPLKLHGADEEDWAAMFREYRPEIKCAVERFKRNYCASSQ